jgi:nucleic acid/nucleotide deaminase of polymorphic system toxin
MALRPAGKTLSSLTGIVVLAAVLWLILNFVYAPSCGRFACSCEPTWLPLAQADSGGCPDSINGAAGDAEWAADRIAAIADLTPTVGRFYDSDGIAHSYDSKKDADSDLALKVGRDAGVFPRSGRPNVVDHVEVKVAAAMRNGGETAGVLVINNAGGPCLLDEDGEVAPMSCLAYLPRLLPDGATLTVWWPDSGGGPPRKQTFVGGQS